MGTREKQKTTAAKTKWRKHGATTKKKTESEQPGKKRWLGDSPGDEVGRCRRHAYVARLSTTCSLDSPQLLTVRLPLVSSTIISRAAVLIRCNMSSARTFSDGAKRPARD